MLLSLPRRKMRNMSKQKNKLLKALLRLIPLAVISVALGLRLYLWNANKLVGNAMPMPFGWGASVVLSGSMEPALSVNDLVFVRTQDSYHTGDVVVYQDGTMLVIHRIVSVNEEEVITQGDANDAADTPVSLASVKGKAVGHIPLAGAVVRFLQTPAGFLLLLAAAVVLFELPYRRERQNAVDEQARLKEEIRRLKGEQEQDS